MFKFCVDVFLAVSSRRLEIRCMVYLEKKNAFSRLFLDRAPTSMCHFFCLSVCPFVHLSVRPSRTISQELHII